MPIYNKVELGRVAQQQGFVRDTFEKVLRLREILRFLNEEEYLREHLLLKDGTAINLTVFNLPRLSVDIGMDYTPNDTKEDMIKIELNYSLRAHILEPVHRRILPEIFDDGMTICMVTPMKIFAAKGNALISRAAARDLYDWGNLIAKNLFADERDMFRKCFVFYTTISAETVNRDFDTSAIDSLKFDKIGRDFFPVLSKKDNFKLDERKQQAKNYIADLMQLTEREQEYMDRFIAKEYVPKLLFDDEEIVGRIKEHPMAIWKCQQ